MVGAAAMAPWREFWPLPLAGPNGLPALQSETMARLAYDRQVSRVSQQSVTAETTPGNRCSLGYYGLPIGIKL